MTKRIESFRELEVYWRAAIELQQEIFEVTGSFPKGEVFSLTDQMRLSSVICPTSSVICHLSSVIFLIFL
jgi:hypothetical protein